MNKGYERDNVIYTLSTKEDVDNIVKMVMKKSVCEHLFFGDLPEEMKRGYFDEQISQMENQIEKNESLTTYMFTMTEKDSDEFIGICAIIEEAFCPGNFVIGYQLDDTKWGKGYGSNAGAFLINLAFNNTSAHRLTGDCMGRNIGSKKIMEKIGFVHEGTQKDFYIKGDSYDDRVLYGLLKKDISAERLEELEELYSI